MKIILQVIEKGEGIIYEGDNCHIRTVKKGDTFRNGAGRFKVLSISKEGNYRKVIVKKLR